MTVYAASSVQTVAVNQPHGCGQAHTRPAKDGDPAAVWGLDCPQCEPYLARDSLWSAERENIPLTFDEQRTAGQAAEKAGRDHGGLLSSVSDLLAGYARRREAVAGSRFCTECAAGVPEAARFCPGCAAPQEPQPAEPAEAVVA
jgi:hypothetical protein